MITMPDPTVEETAVAADGLRLHVERFIPPTPPTGALVVVHGFSAHIGNFRHVGQACARAGLATTLFDCRGHGRSQGRRGHVARFADFVADLDLIIAGARALWPAIPLSLMGHSHGALVSLAYLMEPRAARGQESDRRQGRLTQPAGVRTLACVAPFFALRMQVPAFKRALARPLGVLWPTLALGNGITSDEISRTPEVRAGFYTDPLLHHVATSRWFNEVRATQAWVLAAASGLETPTLILMAGDDRLVSNEATLAFARSAGPVVEVKRYDNLFHEMFLEPERDQVIGDLVRWTIDKQRT